MKSLSVDLKALNEKIQASKYEEFGKESFSYELENCDSFEDKIFETVALLEDSLTTYNRSECHSQLKLPVVPLSKFESLKESLAKA